MPKVGPSVDRPHSLRRKYPLLNSSAMAARSPAAAAAAALDVSERVITVALFEFVMYRGTLFLNHSRLSNVLKG